MSKTEAGPLRLAITGMGGRGVGMMGMILSRSDVKVVALVDRIDGRAELARDHFGLSAPCFADTARCLDETRPDALAVYCSDAEHEQAVLAALGRDVHVYCEKPMATTLAACDRMIAAGAQSRAVFYMGHNMRMSPLYATIHELIAAGEIGELLTLETSEYYYGGRTYFRRWNRLIASGGGLWVTKTVHDFDMMCHLVGDEPASVYAIGGLRHFKARPGAADRCRDCDLRRDCEDYQPPDTLNYDERARDAGQLAFWEAWRRLGEADGYLPSDACLYRSDTETIDHGVATVRFAGGVCATHTLGVVTTPQVSERWLTAAGTKGVIQAEPLAGKVHLSFRAPKPPRVYDVSAMTVGSHGGADQRTLDGFVRSCRHGEPPVAGAADGRRAVMMGLAATKSMNEGVVVPCA